MVSGHTVITPFSGVITSDSERLLKIHQKGVAVSRQKPPVFKFGKMRKTSEGNYQRCGHIAKMLFHSHIIYNGKELIIGALKLFNWFSTVLAEQGIVTTERPGLLHHQNRPVLFRT